MICSDACQHYQGQTDGVLTSCIRASSRIVSAGSEYRSSMGVMICSTVFSESSSTAEMMVTSATAVSKNGPAVHCDDGPSSLSSSSPISVALLASSLGRESAALTAMKADECLEFGLAVDCAMILAEQPVEELCDGPCDRELEVHLPVANVSL